MNPIRYFVRLLSSKNKKNTTITQGGHSGTKLLGQPTEGFATRAEAEAWLANNPGNKATGSEMSRKQKHFVKKVGRIE